MNQNLLIHKALLLLRQARQKYRARLPRQSLTLLVKLRELLNEQPELEAGGDPEYGKETT